MNQCFEIRYDPTRYPDRWHLDAPIDENGQMLDANLLPRRGPYVGPRISKVLVDTRYPGRPLDFSLGYSDFIMVRSHVAELIEQHGGRIQRYPVIVEPMGIAGYDVIFTLDSPKCLIDLGRAEEYEFYTESDSRVVMPYGGIAPRQQGMLYKVYDLYVKPEQATGLAIFRPWEYPELIISGELKSAFEAANVTGIKYRLVS